MDKALGFHLYAAAFAFTAVWSLWEIGLSPWALLPRLAGPCVLMAIALVVAPGLGIASGTRVRSYGFAALGIFLVGLVGAVVTTNRQGIPAALPAQADALYDDPANVPPKGEWAFYGAGRSAQRFSDLTQITPENVKSLRTVWTYHTGDIPAKYGSELTPLKIGHRVYGCSAMDVLFALDASSGKKIWSFDPKVPEAWVPYTAACRGVAYYQVPGADPDMECAERIIEGTLDMRLIAVDAATGKPCSGFGTSGEADLKVGLGQKDSETGKATDVIPGTAAITALPRHGRASPRPCPPGTRPSDDR